MARLRAGDRRFGASSGFIAVPILSLVVWTVNEEAWGADLAGRQRGPPSA